jgi:tRNA pseudouridine32 synthase/23S rRNA pseudouridine746 synthase
VSSDDLATPETSPLPAPQVVFVDDVIVVVAKPSGMPSVPARTPLDPPAVAACLTDSFGPLEAVHRLDRDTSGLLILARSREARAALGMAFEERRVAKRYLAVVAGQPRDSSGTIALPLARDRDSPPRHKVDHEQGRPATTLWRRIATRHAFLHGLAGFAEQKLPVALTPGTQDGPVSLMELEPLTGRSHQLRIHLTTMGYPIVGDRLYGQPPWNTLWSLALHAAGLAFDHPTTGERMILTVPPPDCPPWHDFTSEITTVLATWPSR